LRESQGDLWSFPAEYRVITTNGVVKETDGCLVMGAGVALQAKKRFPHLPGKLGLLVRQWGSRAFYCPYEKLLTLPTKEHYRDLSDIWLIQRGCVQLVQICDKFLIESVALPRPGCGRGGLEWPFVREWIERILDDRFTVVDKEVQDVRNRRLSG
jgi:hypothetical protein